MLVGYARVSTEDQKLDLQVDALKGAGCEKLYSDQVSGASSPSPGLEEGGGAYLRSGNTLVVWKLGAARRTSKAWLTLVQTLPDKGIQFPGRPDGNG
ncbi:MAG: recombinase family protein [Burkholderiales bacterium]|nr:recombinase family protein [Burkholderiales bacterium]